MVAYHIEKKQDLPVVLATWYKGFLYKNDGQAYTRELRALLNSVESPIFYVLDISEIDKITLEGLILSAQAGARDPNSSLHHSMNRGNFIISTKPSIQLAVEGLRKPVYGNVVVECLPTVESALAKIREIIVDE